jgi:hypothetical protein
LWIGYNWCRAGFSVNVENRKVEIVGTLVTPYQISQCHNPENCSIYPVFLLPSLLIPVYNFHIDLSEDSHLCLQRLS